jgi:hypothetical protein
MIPPTNSGHVVKDWLMSHVRTFEYFGGVPEMAIPDYVAFVVMCPDLRTPAARQVVLVIAAT